VVTRAGGGIGAGCADLNIGFTALGAGGAAFGGWV